MWIHINTTLYEPNQYMRWNTCGEFFGGTKRKETLPSKPNSSSHGAICNSSPQSHRGFLNAWLLRSAPGICTSNSAYQVQIENLSRLSNAETLAHQRGFKHSRWKHRRMKEGTGSRVLPLTSWKKAWNVILVTLWCIVMEKSCFSAGEKENNDRKKNFRVRNLLLLLYYYKYFRIKCTLFYRLDSAYLIEITIIGNARSIM